MTARPLQDAGAPPHGGRGSMAAAALCGVGGNACAKRRQRPGGDGAAAVGRTLRGIGDPECPVSAGLRRRRGRRLAATQRVRLSQDPAEARSPPTEMSRQTATGLPTGTSQTGTTSCNSQWASLFQCPMCFNHVLPPIPRCQSGHLVCSNCRPKISRWDPFATCLWRKWPIQSFFL